MKRSASRAVALLAAVALVACGKDSKSANSDVSVGFGETASKEPAMGSGDVKITSTDNTVTMSVIGDTVRIQLSDSLRKAVTTEVDSSVNDKSGIGASIAKSVGSSVGSAMGFVVAVNANDVENLRYEDGHLRFDVKGGKTNIRTSGNSQDKASFTAEDAQKFISAVKARQH